MRTDTSQNFCFETDPLNVFFIFKFLVCDPFRRIAKEKPRLPNFSAFIEESYMLTYMYTEYTHMRQDRDNRYPARKNS